MRSPRPLLRRALYGVALGTLAAAYASASANAATVEVSLANLQVSPAELRITVGDTVVWRNPTGPTHRLREDGARFASPNVPGSASFSYTLVSSGNYSYRCLIHPAMQGTIIVADAPVPGPDIVAPAPGATLPNFGPRLQWANPPGARQVHLQVIPANNDGPGVDLVLGDVTSFEVPAPPAWYGLLPGMSYTWRVRVTAQELPVGPDHPTWGPWSQATFRTPEVDSSTISAVAPVPGGMVDTLTPVLTWANSRSDVFYYEVQLSKDATFTTDPERAVAAVYGALVHGGVTTPPNSYGVPAAAPLEPGTTYHWRVRPRVQGDGTPVPFTPTFSFRTP